MVSKLIGKFHRRQRFGKLEVLGWGVTKISLICNCGNMLMTSPSCLLYRRINSCPDCKGRSKEKHGMTNTRTYNSWRAMRNRCDLESYHSFHHYGGRGITYCDRWRSFNAFLTDLGEVPVGHSLDRIDCDGNYCPENCKWSTFKEQTRNRRCNYSDASYESWCKRNNIPDDDDVPF